MRNNLSSQQLPRYLPVTYSQANTNRLKYTQLLQTKIKAKQTNKYKYMNNDNLPVYAVSSNNVGTSLHKNMENSSKNNGYNFTNNMPLISPYMQKQNSIRDTNISKVSPNRYSPGKYTYSPTYIPDYHNHSNNVSPYNNKNTNVHNTNNTNNSNNINVKNIMNPTRSQNANNTSNNHLKSTSTNNPTTIPCRSTQNLHILQLQSQILQLQSQLDNQHFQIQTLTQQSTYYMQQCQSNKQTLSNLNIDTIKMQYEEQLQELLNQRTKIEDIIVQLQEDYAEVYRKEEEEICKMRQSNQEMAKIIEEELEKKRVMLAIISQKDQELMEKQIDYREAQDRIDQLRNIQRKFLIAIRELQMLKSNRNQRDSHHHNINRNRSASKNLNSNNTKNIQRQYRQNTTNYSRSMPKPIKAQRIIEQQQKRQDSKQKIKQNKIYSQINTFSPQVKSKNQNINQFQHENQRNVSKSHRGYLQRSKQKKRKVYSYFQKQ